MKRFAMQFSDGGTSYPKLTSNREKRHCTNRAQSVANHVQSRYETGPHHPPHNPQLTTCNRELATASLWQNASVGTAHIHDADTSRKPSMNLPNSITMSRIACIPLLIWILSPAFPWQGHGAPGLRGGEQEIIASIVFILASITDGLDGYLARRYAFFTRFGRIADPLADRLLIDIALVLLIWHDRLEWSDEQLERYLASPNIAVWELETDRGESAGYFELQRHDDTSVEIVYFGLLPKFIGRGLGGFMLTRAVEEAWSMGGERVWLHTCTLDSERAVPNYKARGFREYKTQRLEVEIDGTQVVSERLLD